MIHNRTTLSLAVMGTGCYFAGYLHAQSSLFVGFLFAAIVSGFAIWYQPDAETIATQWREYNQRGEVTNE